MKLIDRLKVALPFILKGKREAERFFGTAIPPWQSGRVAAWADDADEQVKHFKHWVYAAASAIGDYVAAVPLRLYVKEDGKPKEITEHPFIDLLDKVNAFHTRFHLFSSTMAFLELTGNAYWYMPANRLGVPSEIWLLQSQNVNVIPSKKCFIEGYRYRVGGQEIKFSAEEVVHLRYPNPRSLYYGRGPLQAAADSVDSHEAMKASVWNHFKNGHFPGTVAIPEEPLDEEQRQRLQGTINELYGGAGNSGKMLILTSAFREVKPFTIAPREMDYLGSAQMTREEILGIFKVPAAIAGLSKDVNRSSADAMIRIFAEFCIRPKLQLLQAQINQDLLPRYDSRLCCEFDNPVPTDKKEKARVHKTYVGIGAESINEVRSDIGREPVEGGDEPLVGANRIPLSQAGSSLPSSELRHVSDSPKRIFDSPRRIFDPSIAVGAPKGPPVKGDQRSKDGAEGQESGEEKSDRKIISGGENA